MENSRQTKMIRLLAFIFTLIGAVGTYNAAISNNERDVLISFAILIVCGFTFLYLGKSKKDRKEPDAFLVELQENKERILNGGWRYKDFVLKPDTVLTQYMFTLSLITVSFKVPSRYYIVGQENTAFVNLIYTSLTFLTGWWGIPMGPIFTVQSLYTNLKGGKRIAVSSILNVA